MRNALLLIILVFTGLSISAQTTTLRGTVADENGMVIPDAYVTVRSGDTVVFQTRTDSEGRFLANVPQGQVSIEIKAECFAGWKIRRYDVPRDLTAELGVISIQIKKCLQVTEECLVGCELYPVESSKPSLSTQIINRPLPSPPKASKEMRKGKKRH